MATLLFVEDDPHIAKAMKIRLEAAGHEVHVVTRGDQVLEAARRLAPEFVVLDVNLPGRTGFEAAEDLRATPELSDLPVVFLTASKRLELRQRAELLGAAGFFEKPFDVKRLVALIAERLAAGGGTLGRAG